jgi:thiamine transport system ATP-binding protein
MLSIEQLAFAYPQSKTRLVEPMLFDFQTKRGEILSIIGPSGSGKSSLMGLIAGFNQASQGKILIDDREIQSLQPAQRPVTIIFQQHNLFPHLDVFTNIALGINPSLKLDHSQRERVSQVLADLGLDSYEKSMPAQLSGGQRQRVAIARALIRKQDILLLDEPFAALGPALREEMIDLLKSIVRSEQMVALMVSHQPADAVLASDNTAFINNGRVVTVQSTERLLGHPELAEIKEYLGKS